MKKIKWNSLWVLPAALCFYSSCSKKSSSTTTCRITSISATDSSYGYSFTLDAQGRTTSMQTITGGVSKESLSFTYSGNAVVTKTVGSSSLTTDSIVLNSNGDIDYILETNDGTSIISTYTYSSAGVISQTSTSTNNATPTVMNYYYSNGDLDSVSDGEKFSYYTDKPYKQGDYIQITYLTRYGNQVSVFKNAHMLKSVTANGSTTTIAYTYDNEGKVTGLAPVGSSLVGFAIGYECGQ